MGKLTHYWIRNVDKLFAGLFCETLITIRSEMARGLQTYNHLLPNCSLTPLLPMQIPHVYRGQILCLLTRGFISHFFQMTLQRRIYCWRSRMSPLTHIQQVRDISISFHCLAEWRPWTFGSRAAGAHWAAVLPQSCASGVVTDVHHNLRQTCAVAQKTGSKIHRIPRENSLTGSKSPGIPWYNTDVKSRIKDPTTKQLAGSKFHKIQLQTSWAGSKIHRIPKKMEM